MDKHLSIETVAARTDFAVGTVRKWITSGAVHGTLRLKATKIGKTYRIREEDFERFWDEYAALTAKADREKPHTPPPSQKQN